MWDPDTTSAGRLDPASRLVSAPVEVASSGHVTSLGPYRVVGTLGRGGMGIVYEVEHDETKERFALKTIETRFLVLPDTNAGRRFTQEIEILERLDHPGVVRLHDYGLVRHPMGYDLAFFVMERLTGATLEDRIASDLRMSAEEAMRLAVDVTSALTYLEDHGVLHRDIKPANVFMEASGRVVLMDFGLARSHEFTRLTQAGHVIGTMAYMSPEALLAHECDGRTDVFALGAVLFELLAGEQPFVTKDATDHVKEIRNGVRWPTGLPDETIVHEAVALIEAMLAPEIERRPDAREVERQARWVLRKDRDTLSAPVGAAHTESFPHEVAREVGPSPFLGADARARTTLDGEGIGSHARPADTSADGAARRGAVDRLRGLVDPRGTGRPTWALAGLLAFVAAGLAFGAGLSIGQGTAPEPVVSVESTERKVEPPPPPPPPPAPPPVPRFERAEDAYRFGAAAFDRGDLDTADDALGQAVALNPVHPEATYLLARTKLALDEPAKAKQLFLQYKVFRPKAPEIEQIDRLLETGL